MKNKKLGLKKGFTLFEMLVVLSIIAIMTATIALSFSAAQKKGRDSKRVEDIKAIQNALEQTYTLNGYTYPPVPLTAIPGILPALPKDPKDKTAYYYYIDNTKLGQGATYCVCSDEKIESTASVNSDSHCSNLGKPTTGKSYCLVGQQ